MKGFTSGVGLVLIVDQGVPALGLEQRFSGYGEQGSLSKALGLLHNVFQAHMPSAVTSGCFLGFILGCTSLKALNRKTGPALHTGLIGLVLPSWWVVRDFYGSSHDCPEFWCPAGGRGGSR